MAVDKEKQEAARNLGDRVAREVEALTSEGFVVDKVSITSKRGEQTLDRVIVTGKG